VHRKKDATDWGVQPQIVVPMTQDQERVAMQQRYEQEIFKRPVAKATTRSALRPTTTDSLTKGGSTTNPSTIASTTQATTQVTDAQLQRAIDTMVALVVLTGDRQAEANGSGAPKTVMPSLPEPATTETSPATAAPATQPASPPLAPTTLPGDEAPAPSLGPATSPNGSDPRHKMPPEIAPPTTAK